MSVEPKEKEEIRILLTINQVETPNKEALVEDLFLWLCQKLDEKQNFENGKDR